MPNPGKLRAWLRQDWSATSARSGMEGARTTALHRGGLWRQMGRKGLLELKCLWDIQGKYSETIVLEGLVSVKDLSFSSQNRSELPYKSLSIE